MYIIHSSTANNKPESEQEASVSFVHKTNIQKSQKGYEKCRKISFQHLMPINLFSLLSETMKKKFKKYFFVFYVYFTVIPFSKTLHITNIVVPPFVDVRDVVMLSCFYNLGSQKLNSVKWYKNEKEFYR
jgi:hypothetical protein